MNNSQARTGHTHYYVTHGIQKFYLWTPKMQHATLWGRGTCNMVGAARPSGMWLRHRVWQLVVNVVGGEAGQGLHHAVDTEYLVQILNPAGDAD